MLRCGCSAPLDGIVCSVDEGHAQTHAVATPRCWCSFRPEIRVGRFAKRG
jgi:hypothetical protein